MTYIINNNRGWIKIVEAFAAILIVSGIVLIIIAQTDMKRQDNSATIHDIEVSILRGIELNDSLRKEILDTSNFVEWGSFPSGVKANIEGKTPSYIECKAQICNPSDECLFTEPHDGDVFAEPVIISSDMDTFKPRMLKIFCWEK